MKSCALVFIALLSACTAFTQAGRDNDLIRILKSRDSLLFERGYNQCDVSVMDKLISEDFEFYHDQFGLTPSKAGFITSVRDGLCKMGYRARRALDQGSLQVYPLKNEDVLYGAIQTGTHRFYALESGKPEYLASTGRFTHLWLLQLGEWKLSRVLSYDHQIEN